MAVCHLLFDALSLLQWWAISPFLPSPYHLQFSRPLTSHHQPQHSSPQAKRSWFIQLFLVQWFSQAWSFTLPFSEIPPVLFLCWDRSLSLHSSYRLYSCIASLVEIQKKVTQDIVEDHLWHLWSWRRARDSPLFLSTYTNLQAFSVDTNIWISSIQIWRWILYHIQRNPLQEAVSPYLQIGVKCNKIGNFYNFIIYSLFYTLFQNISEYQTQRKHLPRSWYH